MLALWQRDSPHVWVNVGWAVRFTDALFRKCFEPRGDHDSGFELVDV